MRPLFFLLILLLPCAAQTYVCWRTWQLLPFPFWGKTIVVALMVIAFILFFISLMPVLDKMPMAMASAVYNVGTSWLVIMFYLLILWVVLDLLRLCHILPTAWLHNNVITSSVIFVALCGLFAYAFEHYTHKVRVPLTLQTQKPVENMRIVLTSDWHLGYHNRRAELARWIDLINAEKPDLVLVAGDLIDHHYRPLVEEQMAEEFHRLQAPIYACLGNHEYFAGERNAEHFFREANIHLLRDSVVEFRGLSLIGRDDRTNPHRRLLAELMKAVRPGTYALLLDHQPYSLEEAEAAGVDFEFAGHTHHGQVWPANWITDLLYECAFGLHRRGNTQYYISSGLGIWGARFRIGTQSEYIIVEIGTD